MVHLALLFFILVTMDKYYDTVWISKISFLEKREIVEFEDGGLYEAHFIIGQANPEDANISNIEIQRLLPSSTEDLDDEYLTIKEAVNRTGYSPHELRNLCKYKIIKSKKVGRYWLLSWKSLSDYLYS